MSVLIIAPPSDDHAVLVKGELERRGESVIVFDVAEVPRRVQISVTFGTDLCATFGREENPFDLDGVETIWLRRVGSPNPPALHDRWYAISECNHLLVGLGLSLADRRWVNPLHALALDGGWAKVRQLQVAQELGLEIPQTIMTNDPERAREFVASCSGGAIFKPFASRLGYDARGDRGAIFTTEVSTETDFRPVAAAPVILQERVEKAFEIRATVMGERVFACAIESQSDPASTIDYRHRYTAVPRRAHTLPAAVEEKILALHRKLGLVHGTCDLIVRSDGGYVFLETNQAGQWAWTADVFPEGALVGAFCDLLCHGRGAG